MDDYKVNGEIARYADGVYWSSTFIHKTFRHKGLGVGTIMHRDFYM